MNNKIISSYNINLVSLKELEFIVKGPFESYYENQLKDHTGKVFLSLSINYSEMYHEISFRKFGTIYLKSKKGDIKYFMPQKVVKQSYFQNEDYFSTVIEYSLDILNQISVIVSVNGNERKILFENDHVFLSGASPKMG